MILNQTVTLKIEVLNIFPVLPDEGKEEFKRWLSSFFKSGTGKYFERFYHVDFNEDENNYDFSDVTFKIS